MNQKDRVKRMPRQSNFELLRICSMLMIVALHILSHGGVSDKLEYGSSYYFCFSIIRAISDVGVNCFVLLGAYFICEKKFSIVRIIKLETQVLVFSVLGLGVVFFCGGKVQFNSIIRALTPTISGEYWFVTCYVILLIVAPLLNILISSLNKKQLEFSIVLLLIVFSVVPTVANWGKGNFSSGNDLAWFICYILSHLG